MTANALRFPSVCRVAAIASFALALACETQRAGAAGTHAPASGDAPAAPAQTVAFGDLVPVVGMERVTERAFIMQMTLDVDVQGQTISTPFASADLEKKHEEILALDGDRVTKLLVTYETMESRKADHEGEKVEPSPVAGKSYVVTRNGDAVTVTRKGKGKLPQAEREVVAKDYARLGDENRICRRLRERPIAVGEAVEFSGADLADTLGGDGSVSLTLREVADVDGRAWARFDAKMSMKTAVERGEVAIDLAGTLLVDVQTCSGETFAATGPFGMKAQGTTKKGTPLAMSGRGEAKFAAADALWAPP